MAPVRAGLLLVSRLLVAGSRPAAGGDFGPSTLDRHCTSTRKSRDAIIYLGQKQHTTYDATHANTLNASMATNVRFCHLVEATGWGVPSWVNTQRLPPMPWSLGYRSMIRFYAVTVWPTLKELGYEWVMRMDDDSFILSPVIHNIFDTMRTTGKQYAYRMLSGECPTRFGTFVQQFVRSQHPGRSATGQWSAERVAELRAKGVDVDFLKLCTTLPRHCRAPAKKQRLANEFHKIAELTAAKNVTMNKKKPVAMVPAALTSVATGLPYCAGPGQYGYYNNWFVTEIKWWLDEPHVAKMVRDFDKSSLIWTHRLNDLIFQTAAIKLYMAPEKRVRLLDFTYQHHTLRHGKVNFGGVESGTADPVAARRLKDYADAYGGRVQRCRVQAENGGPFETILFVNPAMSHSSAPACGKDGTMPFF